MHRVRASLSVAAFLAACATARPPAPPPASAAGPPAATTDAAAPAASASVGVPSAAVATPHPSAPDVRDAGPAGSAPPVIADAVAPGDGATATDLMAMDPMIPRTGTRATVFLLNVDALRATPFSAALTMVVAAKPGWTSVLAAPQVDWVMVSGPSFEPMDRDVAIVRCAGGDDAIDAWLDGMATPSATGPMAIAGAPGVRAVAVNIDRVARVAMRVQPHVVAFVPPDVVFEAAHALSAMRFPSRVTSRETVRFVQKDPRGAFHDAMFDGTTEMRLWIEATPSGPAGGFLEEEALTPAQAVKAAEAMRTWVLETNKDSVSLLTHGLFDHVDVTTHGRVAQGRLRASRDQIGAVLMLIAKELQVGPLPLP